MENLSNCPAILQNFSGPWLRGKSINKKIESIGLTIGDEGCKFIFENMQHIINAASGSFETLDLKSISRLKVIDCGITKESTKVIEDFVRVCVDLNDIIFDGIAKDYL